MASKGRFLVRHYGRNELLSDQVVGELVRLSQAHAREDGIDMCFSRHVQENLLFNMAELWLVRAGKTLVGALGIDYLPEAQVDDRHKWARMRQHYGEVGPVNWLLGLAGRKRERAGPDKSAVIEFFAVEPAYRGQGVGGLLYKEAEKAMKANGRSRMYFLTAQVSKTTRLLLDGHGFAERPLPLVTKFLRRLRGIRESHLFECRIQ